MKCQICEHCSEDCSQILHGRIDAHHKELLSEPIGEMPERLETQDFERWALKFALHWLNQLSPRDRRKISRANPIFLIPDQLALDFKEKILRHIKPAYFSDCEVRGHARMFYGGEYMFRQPVPAEHIIEAARKAELIN